MRFWTLQGGEASGFLSPYPDGALLSAARHIKRCSKLGLCPSTRFHLRGTRRVRARAARGRPARRREHQRRDCCWLDAQRCWGMGHLLGRDCAELDQERSAPVGMRVSRFPY